MTDVTKPACTHALYTRYRDAITITDDRKVLGFQPPRETFFRKFRCKLCKKWLLTEPANGQHEADEDGNGE